MPKTVKRAGADAAALPPPNVERRGAARCVVSWGSFCRLQPWPETRSERVLLHDLSTHGIGLIFAEPPRLGTVLALQLPGDRPGAARWVTAEVRQANRVAERIWLAGCAFDDPLSEEDVRAVLDAADASR